MVVNRLNRCYNIGCERLGIHRRLLFAWGEKLEPLERGEGRPATSREATLRKEINHLKSWKWIFSEVPWAMTRRDASSSTARLARGIYATIPAVMSKSWP
jgi:hypothetical protein